MRPVVHVVTHLRLGAGRYIADLAIEQQRRGHTVAVCLAGDAEGNWKSDPQFVQELRKANVAVWHGIDSFHRQPESLQQAADRLRTQLGLFVPAPIAHSHTATGASVARRAGAATVVSTCHGWNPKRAAEFDVQDAFSFTLCDGIASPSTHWRDRVQAITHRADVQVLPYGFNLDRYPALRRFPGCQRIVCLAELTWRKGQDVLIDAMSRVWRSWPRAELHFLGDGDTRMELERFAREIDPHNRRIRFHGFVDRPYTVLGDFDLMCLPTRSDNQPVAIAEALLAGLPVVSTTVGGIPEQLGSTDNGVCVPPDDPVSLAGALIDRLAAGPSGNSGLARESLDIRRHAVETDCWYAASARS